MRCCSFTTIYNIFCNIFATYSASVKSNFVNLGVWIHLYPVLLTTNRSFRFPWQLVPYFYRALSSFGWRGGATSWASDLEHRSSRTFLVTGHHKITIMLQCRVWPHSTRSFGEGSRVCAAPQQSNKKPSCRRRTARRCSVSRPTCFNHHATTVFLHTYVANGGGGKLPQVYIRFCAN